MSFFLDPKLKDVSFEYLVNGKTIKPEKLTKTSLDLVFGSNEYSITGTFPEYEEINDFEIIINGQNNLVDLDMVFTPFATFQPLWTPNPIDEFMERLWAFKRINYLLGTDTGTQNRCLLHKPY